METPEAAISVLQERVKALEARLSEHQRIQGREQEADQKSVERTRQEMERRLSEMNEFRAQLSQERTAYVTRDMLDARLSGIGERIEQNPRANVARIDLLQGRVEQLERERANLQGRFYSLGVGLSIVVLVINWALRMSGH